MSLIIHLQFGCVLSHSFLCSSIRWQGLAFLARSTGQHVDEDMTPMDMIMIVQYKVSSFLYFYNDFWYNSLGSTCTCQSLIVGTNVKLNFWFIDRLIVNHCEHHNPVIWSAIEVHELLMDKLSNKSGPTSISRRQGLQIIKTFLHCFCRELRRCHGPNIHPWDPGSSRSMPQGHGQHLRDGTNWIVPKIIMQI